MKKTIIIEVLLLVAFVVLMACAIMLLSYAHGVIRDLAKLKIELSSDPQLDEIIKSINPYLVTSLSYGIPALLAAIATLAAMMIIAVKDFPVFKPLVDKFNAKREANKTAKAEKAEADKQARIEKLQAELEELKKDE